VSGLLVNDLAVSGDYVFAAMEAGRLQTIDISDPLNPSGVGYTYTPGSAEGVTVAGSYAYVADGSEGLRVIDITSPANPVERGNYTPSGILANGVTVAGSYAYLAIGDGLSIVDVSDPQNPSETGSYQIPDGPSYGYDVAISGNLAYLIDYNGSVLYIVNVGTPSSPWLSGYYTTPGWAQAIAAAGGYAYVADERRGLQVVDVSTPSTPSSAGSYETVGEPQGVTVDGSYAYVADGDNGLRIIDVATPAQPLAEGEYATRAAANVTVNAGYAYVVDSNGDQCFHVIDVSDPRNPLETGWYNTDWAYDAAIQEDYAYVAGTSGLSIVNVADPAVPWGVGVDGAGTHHSVEVHGDTAYLTRPDGLRTVDVSDPFAPSEIATWSSPGWASDVAVAGSLAYVADGGSGLRIVDLSAGGIVEIGSYEPAGASFERVALDGSTAYVADWNGGLRIINVADYRSPTEIGFYDPPGGVGRDVAVKDGYVYLANDDWGLFILEFAPSTAASIPVEGGTLTSTLDDTTYQFPDGTFSRAVVVTHTVRLPETLPPAGDLVDIQHAFEATAAYSDSSEPAQPVPGASYTITIGYTDEEKGPAAEETLQLYYWDGNTWSQDGILSSDVDQTANQVTSRVNHFSLFAIFGETRQIFLPVVIRSS
jgi:hypothetical protein